MLELCVTFFRENSPFSAILGGINEEIPEDVYDNISWKASGGIPSNILRKLPCWRNLSRFLEKVLGESLRDDQMNVLENSRISSKCSLEVEVEITGNF